MPKQIYGKGTLPVTSLMTGSRRYCDQFRSYQVAHRIQGVPLRLEIGPNDLAKQQTLGVRRDTGTKNPISVDNVSATVLALLETIQKDMYTRAKEEYLSRVKPITKWDDLVPALDNKCVAVIPWCEEEACEDDIKERSGRA